MFFLSYYTGRSEWPLGVLIFTAETMETYNSVFRLLLKLRRIHLNLNQLWKTDETRWDASVLELRWNLLHVLIHLSQYIQTDVIEVQKSVMDRHMDSCQDFDNFRKAHAQFLVVIAAQTFLHVPAVISSFFSCPSLIFFSSLPPIFRFFKILERFILLIVDSIIFCSF